MTPKNNILSTLRGYAIAVFFVVYILAWGLLPERCRPEPPVVDTESPEYRSE